MDTSQDAYRRHSCSASRAKIRAMLLSSAVVPMVLAAQGAAAQGAAAQTAEGDGQADETIEMEEMVVKGLRRTIQTSIDVKRQSQTIVDALSADELGDLPALSVGEAIETITGASTHREQGGASEISIRGLGPFLGSATFNGREATNGSGDRSVNFNQFPSELINTIKIYKTQQADLIEGGVSGQIELETLKPLDYGRRRIQLEGKANFNPYETRIDGTNIGWRGTISYVDQYELGSLGHVGISFGIQRNAVSNPEEGFTSSSEIRDCRLNDPADDGRISSSSNCDSGSGDLVLEVDPDTGVAPDDGTPFLFVPSGRNFRQFITDDERDAIFGALQWRPTDRFEFNFDVQFSDRTFTEIRNDLNFSEQRRNILADSLIVDELGTATFLQGQTSIETNSSFRDRTERYFGGGVTLAYQATDRLLLSFDASVSDTDRTQFDLTTRLRSDSQDIFGETTPAGNQRVDYSYDVRGPGDVPVFTVTNFDVTNHDLFSDDVRIRRDITQSRFNNIRAFRFDADYDAGLGFLDSVKTGVRYSRLRYNDIVRIRNQIDGDDVASLDDRDEVARVSQICRTGFPQSDFLSDARAGDPLVINVDEDGNVLGEFTSYATFDPRCLVREFLGTDDPGPPDGSTDNTGNNNVVERTYAGYLMAGYSGEVFGRAVYGNFGIRLLNTSVRSVGFRQPLEITENPDGTFSIDVISGAPLDTLVIESSNFEWLPSINTIVELDEDVLLRGGIFRGLSRPDPSDLGAGRSFNISDGDSNDVADLINSVSASGNPRLEALTSWNFDAAVEWYPNDDTLLSVGLYYKRFKGGFTQVQAPETFLIDGIEVEVPVTQIFNDDEASDLFGIEVTATHAFTYLPGLLSGLGAKISYNYATSNFEFEDENFGAGTVFVDGEPRQRVGIVAPAEIFGLSKHVLAAQLYYRIGELEVQGIYKLRTQYFQQFVSTPGRIRFIDDTSVVDVRVSYDVNDYLSLKFEALNITDEPRVSTIGPRNNLREVLIYGPRLFAGVRVRF